MAGICAIATVPLEYEPQNLKLYQPPGQHYFLSSSAEWWRVGLLKIPAVCTRSPWDLFTWYKNSSLLWDLKIRHCVHNSPNWFNPMPSKSSRHILTLSLSLSLCRRHFNNRRWQCGSNRKHALCFTYSTGFGSPCGSSSCFLSQQEGFGIYCCMSCYYGRGGVLLFNTRNSERFLLSCQWKK